MCEIKRDRAGIRFDNPQQHADGRGFSRAVGPQKGKYLPALDGKSEIIHRLLSLELLNYGLNVKDVVIHKLALYVHRIRG